MVKGIDALMLKDEVEVLLDTLTEREKKVLKYRFGIGVRGKHTRTLQEIGTKYGVTRECIRQIEARALRRLRMRIRLLNN